MKAVINLDPGLPLLLVPVAIDTAGFNLFAQAGLIQPYQGDFSHLLQIKQTAYQLAAATERLRAARASRMPILSVYGTASSNYVNIPSAQDYHFIAQQATGAKVNVNGVFYDVMAPSYSVASYGVTPFFRQLQKNFGQNIGISFSVPLFSGRSLVVNEKREAVLLAQTRLSGERLALQMRTTVSAAYTEVVAAARKVRLQERIVAEAEHALSAAQKRYGLNLLSTQELLIQQTALQRARQDLLVVQYDFLFKKRLYFFYTGQ